MCISQKICKRMVTKAPLNKGSLEHHSKHFFVHYILMEKGAYSLWNSTFVRHHNNNSYEQLTHGIAHISDIRRGLTNSHVSRSKLLLLL